MTLSIVDKSLLRRLAQGDLRSDSVTDYQALCLNEMVREGLVSIGHLAPRIERYSITDAGRDALA